MYLSAGSVVALVFVGGIASAMGAEDGAGHKMRSATNFAAGQAVEDPRVKAHETTSEMAVQQACGTGTNEWCHIEQQRQQIVGLLLPLVLVVAPIPFLMNRT